MAELISDVVGHWYPTAAEAPSAPAAPVNAPDSMQVSWYGPDGVKKAVDPNQPVKPAVPKPDGSEAKKPAEAQPVKSDTPAPVVPEKYDLQLPENTIVDEAMLNEFTSWAKENKFTAEQAQKLAGMHLQGIEAMAQRQAQDWHQELVNDKDFGGANLDANMAVANKAFASVAESAGVDVKRLGDDLARAGMANHPALVKMFREIGKMLK